MGSLEIYGSQGQLFYPDNQVDQRQSTGFGWRVFEYNPLEPNPYIEAYARIKINGESQQTFVRYYYDDPSQKFNECHRAIREELEHKKGWKILEPDQYDRWKPFWDLIYQNDVAVEITAEKLLKQSPDLSDNWVALQEWLATSDSPSLKLEAPFRELSGLIKVLTGTDHSLLVIDRKQFINAGDIEIRASRGAGKINISEDSKQYLEELAQSNLEKRREEELSKLAGSIRALDDLDASTDTVAAKLRENLRDTFPKITVSRQQSYGFSQPHRRGRTETRPTHNQRTGIGQHSGREGGRSVSDSGGSRIQEAEGTGSPQTTVSSESEPPGKLKRNNQGILRKARAKPLVMIWLILFVAALGLVGFFALGMPGIDLGDRSTATNDFTITAEGNDNLQVAIDGEDEHPYVVQIFEGSEADGEPIKTRDLSIDDTPVDFNLDPGDYTVIVYRDGAPEESQQETATIQEPEARFSMSAQGGEDVQVTIRNGQDVTFVVELFDASETDGDPHESITVTPDETPSEFTPSPGNYEVVVYPEDDTDDRQSETVTVTEEG